MKVEKVTMAAGVPTVWLGLLQHMEKGNLQLPDCNRTVIGGAAAPRAMIETFETKYNIPVVHAWGMTETSPVGLVCNMKPKHALLTHEQRMALKVKQGRVVFGVDVSVSDHNGKEVPRDGKTPGNFRVRGPWIAKEYFKKGEPCVDKDDWFDTGDVVTIDADGYVMITDRSKDLVKSGGEWISSIELENEAMGYSAVHEAAVIGVAHPKWDERPLLVAVLKPGQTATSKDILDYLRPRVSKMWLPDDVVFMDELPHTATGKVLKTSLKAQFKDYKLPTL
jgi:fatty-acyl-CoA synthase